LANSVTNKDLVQVKAVVEIKERIWLAQLRMCAEELHTKDPGTVRAHLNSQQPQEDPALALDRDPVQSGS
jgi:hypothetical protein